MILQRWTELEMYQCFWCFCFSENYLWISVESSLYDCIDISERTKFIKGFKKVYLAPSLGCSSPRCGMSLVAPLMSYQWQKCDRQGRKAHTVRPVSREAGLRSGLRSDPLTRTVLHRQASVDPRSPPAGLFPAGLSPSRRTTNLWLCINVPWTYDFGV